MTIKPFAIQGADLTLGGVSLQAGTTGVVIPGVTRATNYKVEEVNDTDVDQTHVFAADSEVVVVDYVLYNAIVNQTTENLYADFTATTDDDGEIDDIEVNGRGTYTQQQATDNAANDMYAYIGSGSASTRPIVTEDWITIPFRPKMRAGTVELEGGGSSGGTGLVEREVNFPYGESGDTEGTLALTPGNEVYVCIADYVEPDDETIEFDVVTSEPYLIGQSDGTKMNVVIAQGDYPEIDAIMQALGTQTTGWEVYSNNITDGATWECTEAGDWGQGRAWHFEWTYHPGNDANSIDQGEAFTLYYTAQQSIEVIWKQISTGTANLVQFQYAGGISQQEDDAPNRYNIFINAEKDVVFNTDENGNEFRLTSDGELKFPDGSVQTTAYTGQATGGSGVLFIMANIDGNIVTSDDGVTWGTPIPSGMAGIRRVAVHNGVIVYIADGTEGPGTPGLYYSTVIGAVDLCTGTDVYVGEGSADIYWNQVRYFEDTEKWVAVGRIAGGNNDYPVVAYSSNGINWTVVLADNEFVNSFNPDNLDWELTDISFLAETQEYVISSDIDSPGVYGGIFVVSNITVPLDGSTHVAIDLNVDHTAPWSVVGFGGPDGYMVLFSTNDEVWFGYGTTVENYSLDNTFWDDSVLDELGYVPVISEVAYDSNNFIAVTVDGQVITSAFAMGPYWVVSVPLPYTVTDFSITNANPAVLTYTAPTGESPDSTGLNDNEKIVITGSGEYNGTYYYKLSDDTLYTDQALTTALDASGFATFASGGTLTMSKGTYFDAAGRSPSYYYIGNDDEQIFRSSNGITWTLLADVTGEFFNDFAYGTFGGTSTDRLVNGESVVVLNDNGTTVFPGNLAGSELADRLYLGGSDSEGTPSISIPSETAGENEYIWIQNQQGAGIRISTAGNTNWNFNDLGELQFPDNTKQTTAYVHRNINLDGGGAAVHYEQDVGYADGGFSSTRHGVADPAFDGGTRLTESNQYNLNGGGA